MNYLRISLLILAMAVILGAFGAHALKSKLDADQLKVYHTAVEYHFYHGLGMLMLAVLFKFTDVNHARLGKALSFMLAGIICFSGSLYLMTMFQMVGWNYKWLGPITPIGGVFFISAWVVAAFSLGKKNGN